MQMRKLCGANDTHAQVRNQLGTPGGAKSYMTGSKVFELCPIVLNDVQHIFPGGQKNFLGASPPCAPLVTDLHTLRVRIAKEVLALERKAPEALSIACF